MLLAAKRHSEAVFTPVEVTPSTAGFLSRVDVFGQQYLGVIQRQKKLSQQSAAAHALYALKHKEGIDVNAALQNGSAKKGQAPRVPADAGPELRVAPPLATGAGWEQMVGPESKWAPQETPKEKLMLLAVKRKIPLTFQEVEVTPPDSGFHAKVVMLGQSYPGTVQRQKKLAQQSAAAHALFALHQADVKGAATAPNASSSTLAELWNRPGTAGVA